ncbi:MAG: terminase family protein [Pseudomonadota bacterium]
MTAPISQAEWERLRLDATEAIDDVVEAVGLPDVLLPYQKKVVALLDGTSEIAAASVLFVEKSRRIGLTWGLAAYAVLRASRKRTAGGMDAMYISYSQEMTREFIDACGMWARAFSLAATEVDEFLFPDKDENGDRAIGAFRIKLASGFEIIALSSAPRSLRGKQGLVIIDEAAFVDSLAELLKAALAFLMWGGQVVVCSTHDGAENPFNVVVEEIKAGRSKYAHVRIDFDQALQDGLYERIALVTGKEWTPESEAKWRQDIIDFYADGADEELFCIPSKSSGAWLSTPLIEARMTEKDAPILRLELPGDYLQRSDLEQRSLMAPFHEQLEEALGTLDLDLLYAAGFDFARVADLSVMPLLAIEQRLRRRQALCVEMRNVPGTEQKAVVGQVLGHVRPRLIGAAFDATGMGWTVAEDMGRQFGLKETPDGPGLIHAIKFTEEWYRVNMPPLKGAFEDASIAISPDDEHLEDLRTVKLVRGTPRVPDLRTGAKGKRRHGDYAIGLGLAHFASRMPRQDFGYRPATTGRHRQAERRGWNRPNRENDQPKGRDWWDSPLGTGVRGGL